MSLTDPVTPAGQGHDETSGRDSRQGDQRHPRDERVALLERLLRDHQQAYLACAVALLRAAGITQAPLRGLEIVNDACVSALTAFKRSATKLFPHPGSDGRKEFFGYIRFAARHWLRKNKPWESGRTGEWEEALDDSELADYANDMITSIDFRAWFDELSVADREIVGLGIGIIRYDRFGHLDMGRRMTAHEIVRVLSSKYGVHLSPAAVRKRKSRLLANLRKWLEAS